MINGLLQIMESINDISIYHFLICMYIYTIHLLWGLYSVKQQIKYNGFSWFKIPFVFILNFLFFPIAIIVILFRKNT